MLMDIARDEEIAVLTLDNPPVNALSAAVRKALWEAAEAVDADPAVAAVVLLCAGRTFVAGADVREFGQPPVPPLLPELIGRIERAAKPWLAAIHGAALGGGLELSLGCRWRIAVPTARLGLPEVTLGLVPGAGGTVRTPRAIGVAGAVELATTGAPLAAPRARELGLIDALAEGCDLRADALAFLRTALGRPLPPPLCDRPVAAPPLGFWAEAEAKLPPGPAAPARALACVRKAAEVAFGAALAFERATFLDLRDSDQAAALRAVFFAERSAARPSALKGVEPRPVARAVVLGAGAEADALRALLARGGLAESAVEVADLVIAAGPEAAQALAAASPRCNPAAILACAALPLPDLPGPERVVGLHLPEPLALSGLLEVLPLPQTAPDVRAAGLALATRLGRLPVLAGLPGGPVTPRLRAAAAGAAPETAMAETGALMLAEGTVAGAQDIDLAVIHGMGWPRWEGGPMHRARRRGAEALERDLGRPLSPALAAWLAEDG
jgi:3-hydroxyacyl-CoA dehydrogenase